MTVTPVDPGLRTPQLAEFRARCAEVAGARLDDPGALHAFSVEHPVEFWRTLLTWSGLPWSGSADVVLSGDDVETARFFPDVRLNYAEALLRPLPGDDDDRLALTSVHAGRPTERFSRAELRTRVQRTAAALADVELRAGDRMVLIAPNTADAVVAALAGAAVGAAVSTATPDMGAAALLGRFEQVEPVLLVLDRAGMPEETVSALLAGLPTVRRLLVLDELPLAEDGPRADRLCTLAAAASPVPWERRPFDTPLFVMFSSGTTGPPKAMVHGAGGTLLEHVKEHRLHGDLGCEDTLYFHTTTAWMMWNWQLSALAVGAHIVLYDGPVLGPETLWELVAEHRVSVFGTSPAYLQLCQDAGYRPAAAVDLSHVRAVLSTGAVLHDWQFDWVADAVGPVPLQSISGGTDIIGCFVLGSPESPVRQGRCQTRSLGLDVAAVDEDGHEVVGQVGELVCRRPFPSRPLGFLRDPDGARFHASYFAEHPGMWTHGDLIQFDTDGSARLHGRSDGVLNIDGIRIGPSEIYTVLRTLPGIEDAMAVEQRDADRPGGSRMVLLVVLRPGTTLDGELQRTIRRTLRQQASAAHVPSLVVAVPELPLTHNGKRSERAAREAVNGDPVANRDALRNPGSLAAIAAAVGVPHPSEGPAAHAPEVAAGGQETSSAAPADRGDGADVEREATRIWCEVLNVDEADPGDDFSDLGGTSRQVMSLLRRVRLELGVDVRVQEFVLQPQLGALVRAIRSAASAGSVDVPLLRAGHGRPLFLVGDAWGQVIPYAALVQRLRTDRPVYGLCLPMVDADGRHRTIPEIARDTMTLMRRVQPSGPYSLAGYSFGGLVAYELACMLTAAGHAVAYLGLIDVLPPSAALTRREATARRWARNLDVVLSGALPRTVAGKLRARLTRSPVSSEEEFFDDSWIVANAFRPGRYEGPVTYFQAEDRLPFVGNLLAAWRRVAPHLFVTEVPGHHDGDDTRVSVLAEQVADELAGRISATLS
jgi:acetoacetyl-CoA synthetase